MWRKVNYLISDDPFKKAAFSKRGHCCWWQVRWLMRRNVSLITIGVKMKFSDLQNRIKWSETSLEKNMIDFFEHFVQFFRFWCHYLSNSRSQLHKLNWSFFRRLVWVRFEWVTLPSTKMAQFEFDQLYTMKKKPEWQICRIIQKQKFDEWSIKSNVPISITLLRGCIAQSIPRFNSRHSQKFSFDVAEI